MSQPNQPALQSGNQPSETFDTSLFFILSLDVFCIAGTDGYFKKVNPAFTALLGYTEEELLSHPYIDLVHPDDKSKTLQECRLMGKGQKGNFFENRYRKKTGEYCWLSWSGTMTNEGLIYAVAKDVTRKKQQEERLKKSAGETRRILESITDGFYSIDKNGVVTYMNQASEMFTGKKRRDVLGRNIWEAFPEAVQTPLFQLAAQGHRKLRPFNFELFYKPLQQWIEVTVYPSKEGVSVYLKLVSGKKKNDKDLKEAQERYELITEATSSSIWEWEIGSATAYWQGNKMKEYLGTPIPGNAGNYNSWETGVHPEDLPQVYQRLEKALINREEYFVNEYRSLNKFGEYSYIRNRCKIIWNARGEAIKIIGVMDDVTAERLAEEALISSEKDYKSLFNNAPLPQLIYDMETLQILDVNDAAIRHYGYSIGEFLHMTLVDIKPEENHEEFNKVADRLRKDKGPIRLVEDHVKKNGERITVELTTVRVSYKGHNARLTTVNDITEKIKLQENITQLRVLEHRKIAQATFSALEQERFHIGKELHDNVNQILTSTKLYLELAKEREDIRSSLLEKCTCNVEGAIQEIRLLSRSLTSPIIKDLGLLRAVNDVISPYLLSKKFEVHFTHKGCIDDLPHDIQFTVFRIVQEQLNNINKHAAATNVWLNIAALKAGIEVVIKDDGIGFDASVKSEGIGLRNIKSRVAFLKGRVDIISKPGYGCTIKVHIPFKPAALPGDTLPRP